MSAHSHADNHAAEADTVTSNYKGARYQYADDTSRVADFDKDTGSDERIEVEGVDRSSSWFYNGKRTYDLHQTLDTDQITNTRKHQSKLDSLELAEREQRIRHIEAEFNQRMRHADRMDATSNSVIAGILGDMAEKLGVVYEKVK